jgi:DnaJ-class molecular chaperone
MSFHKRKAERKLYFEKYISGWKLRPCVACNGSGKYDNYDNPPCGACGGTGKQRYKPEPK